MIALLVIVSGLATPVPGFEPAHATVRVRACADARVNPSALRLAQDAAERLLAPAGITTMWRGCDAIESAGIDPIPEVVVILSSSLQAGAGSHCGIAARGPGSQGTAMISVPCVQDVALRLSRKEHARAHPLSTHPRYEDLIGLTLAHEIGHVLGLTHAPSGLMKPTFDAEVILAVRSSRLAFSPQESAAMRRTVVAATLARAHPLGARD